MHQKPLESTRDHYSPAFLQEQRDLHRVLWSGLWAGPMSQGARVGTLLQKTLWQEEKGWGLQGHTCSLGRACWGREPVEPQEERGTFQETALVQGETVLASRGQQGIRLGQMAYWETGLELLGQGEERQDLQRGVGLDHLGQPRATLGQQGVPQAKKEQQGHQEQQGVHQAMQGQLGQKGQRGSLRATQGQLGQRGLPQATQEQLCQQGSLQATQGQLGQRGQQEVHWAMRGQRVL